MNNEELIQDNIRLETEIKRLISINHDKDLRDHFAGLAMQVFLKDVLSNGDEEGALEITTMSYELADAMLKEREKKEDGGVKCQ